MKKYCFIFLLLCLIISSGAQTKYKDSDYRKHPYWIEMIEDPNVNYFEAIKAYELFWKDKPLPKDEDALIGESKDGGSKKGDKMSRREIREEKEEKEMRQKYGLDCKKFEHWKMMVQPYIQPDGHILTKEEQLKLHDQQRH
jgi:hypothetical protein